MAVMMEVDMRHSRMRAIANMQCVACSTLSFKLLLFLEEPASVLLTPFILAYSLPRCAGEVGVFEYVLGSVAVVVLSLR
jgi:hypothetical protein